jgi:hypothetical protein
MTEVKSMPVTNDQFFVHVVESPSSEDLLDGRTEGRVLLEALGLSNVPATYNLVTSRSTLIEALGYRLVEAMDSWGRFPILHLSFHGNSNGVALTDREFISWHDLRQLLLPINQATGGGLIVCLSSCFGASGCRMAMHENQPLPFLALVGHPESVCLSDVAVGFVAFYHRLRKGTTVYDAVKAMKSASGDQSFGVLTGTDIHEGYVSFLKRQRLEEQRQAILEYLKTPCPPSAAASAFPLQA